VHQLKTEIEYQPRWPSVLAILAVLGLYLALPEYLTFGPTWAVPVIALVLLVPAIVARTRGYHRANQILGHILLAVLTLAMIGSLGLLISALPSHKQAPKDLLISAAALWATNILVFASWYWRLDAGGPYQRDLQGRHVDGAFLFPQMYMSEQAKEEAGEECWRPGFVDYLFLAFNTSTAFSPTDTPVLTPWAKLMSMTQSAISLATIALLAARAVNIL
jgi:hypothetical protein